MVIQLINLRRLRFWVQAKKFAMGSDHTAAITENGDLYCWGDNSFGQVGMGTDNVIQKEPVKILENIKDISLGYWCSAAISEKGDLYCWGCNRNGQVKWNIYRKGNSSNKNIR